VSPGFDGRCTLQPRIIVAWRRLLLSSALLFTCSSPGAAQSPPGAPVSASITLSQAVEAALSKYPGVSVFTEQVRYATAILKQAQLAFLPRVDAVAQVNRATHNNVYGLLFPTGVLPSISGPAIQTNDPNSVWGSAIGVVVDWQPYDFGFRAAGVSAARAGADRSEQSLARTRLDVAASTADAFLTVAAADVIERVTTANVERARTLLNVAKALADAGVRPRVEADRAQVEHALAEDALLTAHGAVQAARALLASLVGRDTADVTPVIDPLLEDRSLGLPPASDASRATVPFIREQQAAIAEADAQLQRLEASYKPRLDVEAVSYARGTGVAPNALALTDANGLAPDVRNWGVGFTATFPLMQIATRRAAREAGAARVRGEQARLEQLSLDLKGRREAARAHLDAAIAVARNTPNALNAAQRAAREALVRYRTGLSTVVDVAEAQRLLAQTEAEHGRARLDVWRERLTLLALEGSLDQLLREISQ